MAFINCKSCNKKIDSRSKSGKCQSCYMASRTFSKETRKKMSEAKKKNPTNYWLGKKRPEVKKWLKGFKKGHKPWNKGKAWSSKIKEKIKKANKGKRNSPKTEFKKGIIPWNTGKREGKSLSCLHKYIREDYGKATICDKCGSTKKVEWSNKDHKYKMDRKYWQRLCRKCHMEYDRKMGLRPEP